MPVVASAASTPLPAVLTPSTIDFSLSTLIGSVRHSIYSPLPAITRFTETTTVIATASQREPPTAWTPATVVPELMVPGFTTPAPVSSPANLLVSALEPSLADLVGGSTELLPGSASTRSSTIVTTTPAMTATEAPLPVILDLATVSYDEKGASHFEVVPRQQE